MLTKEYISFDYIEIDHEAARFEAQLYEPDASHFYSNLVTTLGSSTSKSSCTSKTHSSPTPPCARLNDTTNNKADECMVDEGPDSASTEATNRPNRSKVEAAHATARLASHMRQLSRGLGLGRAGQIQTVQQAEHSNTAADNADASVHIGTSPSSDATEKVRPALLNPGYIASGCPGLERLLPGGGYEPGCLVEWFYSGAGGAAGSLAMLSAIPAVREGQALVIIDWNHTFYPPAAAALGADLKRLVVVRPTSREDGWWSLDQALRCTAVGAVWSELPDEMDDRLARRLQLAAETGGTLGMLIRHSRTRHRPSWADVQWQVRTASYRDFSISYPHNTPSNSGRYVQVDLVRCRSGAGHGGYKRQSIWLELGQPVRPPLSTSVFSSPHSPISSTVRTTWIRELPAPQTLTPAQPKHPASKLGHMRNDSYDGMQSSSYTQRMATQLAMPTRTTTATTATDTINYRPNPVSSTNSAAAHPSTHRAVSA